MTETTFGKRLLDVYFDVLIWPVCCLLTRVGRIYDLYCSQPPGGDQDALDSLLGSCDPVSLLIYVTDVNPNQPKPQQVDFVLLF